MWKKKKNIRKMAFNTETVLMAAKAPLNTVLTYFQTTSLGLTDEEVEKRQGLYGKNEIVHEQKKKPLVMLAKAFINPFVGVLTILVAISYVMDVWMADPGDQDWTSIIVVSTMIILSTILRFVQEWKANRSSEALQKMVTNTCYVVRLGSTTRGGTPGAEISRQATCMGFRRFEQIHDLDWTYQFDIRYCHLHGDVVGILLSYCVLTQWLKTLYIQSFKRWL